MAIGAAHLTGAATPLTRQDSRGFETHRAHLMTCAFLRLGTLGQPTQNQRTRQGPNRIADHRMPSSRAMSSTDRSELKTT